MLTPSITGTVYLDGDQSGSPSVGEGLSDVLVEIYQDDGDGVLDVDVDLMLDGDFTDDDGEYCFEDLDPDVIEGIYDR